MPDFPATDYDSWRHAATAQSADVLTESVLGWRWFAEAARDTEHATVYASQSPVEPYPRIASIAFRDGNKHALLFERSAWPTITLRDPIDGHSTSRLPTMDEWQAANETLGVLLYPTPSGLGQASMRASVKGRYVTPSYPVDQDVRAHLVGGRAELDDPIERPTASHQDRKMCYVAEAANELPIGAATGLNGPDVPRGYAAHYTRCVVYIHRPLPIGPFPLRIGPRPRVVSYPREPGTYEDVWLWNGELADTLGAGCSVIVRDGWGWRRAAPVLADWSERVFRARERSPAAVAAIIKQAAVAAIGCFAMQDNFLVVEPDKGQEGETILSRSKHITDYVAVRHAHPYPTAMPVWASYLWSLARQNLYHRALAEGGNWLGWSNFDSLLTEQPTRLLTGVGLGEWRDERLTNVVADRRRWLISDEMRTTPGVDSGGPQTASEFVLMLRELRKGKPRAYNANGIDLNAALPLNKMMDPYDD